MNNSRIYLGRVRHRRFTPNTHEFSYSLFMMYLDLEELPSLFNRFWLWSANKPNIAWFDRKQHLGGGKNLTHSVRQLVQQKAGYRPTGPIRLLTHLKYFGYGFNPVSFYYCFDDDGATLNTIVAEVNNTPWKEQHCYVMPVKKSATTSFQFSFNKDFHVSPFNPMNQNYDWRFSIPSDHLAVHMTVNETGKRIFDATIKLKAQEINAASLSRALLQFPLMTSKVVAAIYYQAFKLWVKRTPFHPHPSSLTESKTVNKL